MNAIWIGLALSSVLAQAAAGESALQKMEREIAGVVRKVRPSVVQVAAVVSGERRTFAGVVYSRDGHIVTDASGVEAAGEIRVTAGDREMEARHIASDRLTGVAVLKVEAEDLTPAEFTEAPGVAGATAVAVGNAFGLPGGASVGNVGGLGRTITVGGRTYDEMIQMNLLVHPGDCGGFVADSGGRFIGLVHSALPPLTPWMASVSFATPAEWVRFAADRIIKHRKMVRGRLGAGLRAPDAMMRAQLGLKEGEGAEIVRMDRDGPARDAKLRLHDILTEFGGRAVGDLGALRWRILRAEEPETVKVAILRQGERQELDVRIEVGE